MSDRPGSDRAPTVERPGDDRERLSVAQAAARLGLSTDAVRGRLNRGTLEGRKEADGWVVYLPPPPTVDQPSATVGRASPDRAEAIEALIAGQREEIAFLRAQLDHSRRELAAERERFDVIHRTALARLEALTEGAARADAPVAAPEAPHAAPAADPRPDPSQSARRPWWRWLFGLP
jgi:hypothetical protein